MARAKRPSRPGAPVILSEGADSRRESAPRVGPLKPSFGLSGAVPLPDTFSPPLVRVLALSIPTRFRPVPHSQLRSGENCSTPNLPDVRITPPSPDCGECNAAFPQTADNLEHCNRSTSFARNAPRRQSNAATHPASTTSTRRPASFVLSSQPAAHSIPQVAHSSRPDHSIRPVAHSSRLWLEWGTSTAVNIPLRFAEQQMHMLRHDHIPVNLKPKTAPHPLQGCLEYSPGFVVGK